MSTTTFHGSACCAPKPWYLKKAWWVVVLSLGLGSAGQWISLLHPFAKAFWEYLAVIGPAVGAGLVIGGLIDHYVPKEYISRFLARPQKRTVLLATSLGLVASACSHGILALSMELHKKGASGPAVVSFLLASPWANFPVTLILIGLFGWKGLVIVVTALIVALTTGLIFQWLERKGWIERNRNTASVDLSFSVRADVIRRFRGYSFGMGQLKKDVMGIWRSLLELSEMVLGWVMVGIVLASFVQAYVPASLFRSYLGPNLPGLLVTLLFATLLEVCSEGTAPLAFEIYRQTQALGNSFVFLSAGVITDYMEIGLIWTNLGRRTAVWLILVGVPQVLFWGYLFNLFF